MKSFYLTRNWTLVYMLILFMFQSFDGLSQNVAITDDDGYTVHSSAMLDVKSTTKGLLIPRLSTAQRTTLSSSAATGLLVFDSNESTFYYFDGAGWVDLSKGQIWDVNSQFVLLTDSTAKVGIGTYTPNSKLEVKADASFTDADTLFSVKDKNGNIVFAVFPDGAAVYVNETAKGKIGGFAVSGRNPAKATETEYLRVTTDSTRIWVNNDAVKGKIGGFAVSGRNPAKGISDEYMVITPDSTRIYINDTVGVKGKIGGFAVSGRNPAKGVTSEIFLATVDSTRIYIDETNMKGKIGGFAVSGRNPAKGELNKYMEVSRDSTRIYVTEDLAKGKIGGFAVSGRNPAKGPANDYFNVSGNTTADVVNNESRVMWYPQKAALLAGEVHVGSADSVGTNSTAIGYRNISKGDYSQAMGYQSKALGINSTALGKNALALSSNSFAMGDSAEARGIGSYAFGSTGIDTVSDMPTTVQTIANGDYSFAFGFGSIADGTGGLALGTNTYSAGEYSMAIGINDTTYGDHSYALGINSVASGLGSFAIGFENEATKKGAYAIGNQCMADGQSSFSLGYQSYSTGISSIAIGYQDTALVGSSLAMGFNSNAENAFSIALGTAAVSSGIASTAIGWGPEASGDYSTALGNLTEATGGSSTALGKTTIASGIASTAMGVSTIASGDYSVAGGNQTEATAGSTTAFGFQCQATTRRAFAAGFSNIASGDASVALGNDTEASNFFAMSTGASTVASGHTSTAMGNTITVSGYSSFGIGLDPTSYTVSQDYTFSVMGGDVGIGTVAPAERLHVAGDIRLDAGGDIAFTDDNTRVYEYLDDLYFTADDDLLLSPDDDIFIATGDNTTYWVRFDNGSEEIGIGTTNPLRQVHIKQNIDKKAIRMENSANSNYWEIGSGSGADKLKFIYNGIEKANINDADGAYEQLSDRRLKKDIEEIGPVLDRVINLKPSSFRLIDDDEKEPKSIGFIAQEVEVLFPELVNDFTKSDDETLYKGLTYDDFAVLSIQSVIDLNNKLEQELNKKESEIQMLNEKIAKQEEQYIELIKRIESLERAEKY